jgi:hypothetical protein
LWRGLRTGKECEDQNFCPHYSTPSGLQFEKQPREYCDRVINTVTSDCVRSSNITGG